MLWKPIFIRLPEHRKEMRVKKRLKMLFLVDILNVFQLADYH